ncbi:hypothetical protein GCM10025771_23150 [Niveibacterium umoris]|uniref:MSHA biogenesis protein MshP n=1 Tax=Niveibacterium umoris TaxID=1193620 RepID=A0A840BPY8_9RHOO|nr:hypothetical protein [Niveibacterium umoris]MBB4012497.1 MSHA biogenesis protein MshP [Niveibacterium umoris]
MCRERGFLLPAAVFLLVVLAGMAAFLLRVSASTQQTVALDLQGVRAYQAARAGIEYGLYQVQRSGVCAASTSVTLPAGFNGFSVNLQCSGTSFQEAGSGRTLYQLSATASYGSAGSSDFVERQIVASTER